jgi:hypothetical protein
MVAWMPWRPAPRARRLWLVAGPLVFACMVFRVLVGLGASLFPLFPLPTNFKIRIPFTPYFPHSPSPFPALFRTVLRPLDPPQRPHARRQLLQVHDKHLQRGNHLVVGHGRLVVGGRRVMSLG